MPQASNITVKNGASTPVDKTFTLISPAAGDGGMAQWALKEGAISSVFPRLTAAAQPSTAAGSGIRNLTIKLRVPSFYTDSVTGLVEVGAYAEMNCRFTVPDSFPEDKKADWVAFATNLIGSSLIKELIRDAYPAT